MKLIGYLLMTLALVAGALAAATAYLVPLSLPDERLTGLVLASPAGAFDPRANPELAERVDDIREQIEEQSEDAPKPLLQREASEVDLPEIPDVETERPAQQRVQERESVKPIARGGDPLVPELLDLLRQENVDYIKVKDFSLARWPQKWMFLGAVALMLVGALMVRTASKAQMKAPTPEAAGAPADTPEGALEQIRDTVDRLLLEVPQLEDERERVARIVEGLGVAQREHVDAFLRARASLIARFGLSGYAEIMDRFAAMERQINRAWSAAADNVYEEAIDCLSLSRTLLEETDRRIQQG